MTVGTGRALNKLAWDKKDGRKAALGSSDGTVCIYEVGDGLSVPREAEWTELSRVFAGMSGAGEDGSG